MAPARLRVASLQRYDYFPTPMWAFALEDHAHLDRGIAQLATSLRAEDPAGLRRSNRRGWHSDLLARDRSPDLATLVELIDDLALRIAQDLAWDLDSQRFAVDGLWINALGEGGYHERHRHENAVLSGVYYVRVSQDAGALVLEDPRPAAGMIQPRRAGVNPLSAASIRLEPEPGLLLIWPAWLPHRVDPNNSTETRISVSFNIPAVPRESPAHGIGV